MKKVLMFILISWSVVGLSQSKQFFGSHLTSASPWVNKIHVFNTNTENLSFQLVIYDTEGEQVYSETYTITGYDCLSMVSTSFIGYVPENDEVVLTPFEGSFMISTDNENLIPLLSYQYGDSQSISQFFLSEVTGTAFMLPNMKEEHFSWTGLALMNNGENTLTASLEAFQKGVSLGQTQVDIQPFSKFVDISGNIWDGLGLNDFDQIIISSETEFPTPILITGNETQDRHVFFSGQCIQVSSDLGESTENYNLFAPINSTVTYLMDNEENVVHTWSSDYQPGNSVYLLEDGSILRTCKAMNQDFTAGGTGGGIQKITWDGTVIWEYYYSSDTFRQHHDIELLPNGNVLLVAWQLISEGEVIQAGRNDSLVSDSGLWVDSIIEVKPTGADSGDIVWEWHLFDHLIQDSNISKDNYGVISDHPELVDFNYARNDEPDWTHVNSVDYNAELDQIVISVHNLHEIWIIDHSTTSEEAASHSGGDSGKGGDLLYRWGNPQVYDHGSSSDQQLFSQHDAEWISEGYQGEGNILIFNNGGRRPDGNYSSIEEIEPPVNPDGSYTLNEDSVFGPELPVWNYTADNPTDFYATNISGSQRLLNGNTLICDGPVGRFFEVTPDGDTVWEYSYGSSVFRVDRYNVPSSIIESKNKSFN